MENSVKVSVIIPCFNSQMWINKCLDSIPKRNDVEIICINDGSKDATKEMLEKYKEKKNKDLKIISYKTNKGVSYARNKGIEASKGEYLVMIDSDDYIYADVFNNIVDNCLNGDDLVFYDMESNAKFRFEATQNNYKSKYGNFKFIRKGFLNDFRYSEGKNYAEDKELHLKMMEKYPKCYFTRQLMYHYNYPRAGSLSAIGENR